METVWKIPVQAHNAQEVVAIRWQTCCPQHPIRLRASCFSPNKQQRAVMRKLERYLATGTHRLKSNSNCKSTKKRKPTNSIGTQCKHPSGSSTTTLPAFVLDELNTRIRDAVILACQKKELPVEFSCHDALQSAGEVRVSTTRSSAKYRRVSCPPPDLCCPLPLKLAGMLNSSTFSSSSPKSKFWVVNDYSAKHIGDIIAQQINVPKWASIIIAKNGFMNFYLNDSAVEGGVKSAASAIHVDKRELTMAASSEVRKEFDLEQDGDNCVVASNNYGPVHADVGLNSHLPTTMNSPSKELPRLSGGLNPHVLSVSTVQAVASDEVLELYQKYQMAVHGDTLDECGRTEFEKFLVDSPLSSASNDSPPLICSTADNTNNIDSNLYIPYGSYHQHYRIDGQLVAVGIIDILPSTLNSVYCFYDPDFRDLSLGKVVAMKEINWAQRCQQVRPDIQYYCLGFYVHTCSKMSYKSEYAPAELLSPSIPGLWLPFDQCKPLLDADDHDRLQLDVKMSVSSDATHKAADLAIKDETMEHAINSILLLSDGTLYTLRSLPFKYLGTAVYEYAKKFVGMIGPDMAHRIVLDLGN